MHIRAPRRPGGRFLQKFMSLRFALFASALVVLSAHAVGACTSIGVGRKATTDGSTLGALCFRGRAITLCRLRSLTADPPPACPSVVDMEVKPPYRQCPFYFQLVLKFATVVFT
jgi:hypothetical protein